MFKIVIFFAFAILSAFASEPEAETELLQEYTTENYAYGDDGIDCEIDVFDIKVLSQSGSALTGEAHRLLTYKADQPREPFGCGLRFTCYALIRKVKTKSDLELIWANCEPFRSEAR